MQTVKEYFDSVKGKRICFIGAGISHRDLIPRYAAQGAEVTLCDRRDEASLGDYAKTLRSLGVKLHLGENYLDSLCDADIVFRTPGVDYTKPEIQAAVAAGVKVTSEIETFFDLCPCRTVGVTGSDGKTTTTTLTAKILEAAGYRVHLGGNIGFPLLPRIDDVRPDDIVVAELSSFQLISMRRSPDFSLVTNVTPNHLDHHKDMREYIDAKRNILLHQNENGVAVLFADNDVTQEMRADVRGELRQFSWHPVEHGTFIQNNVLYKSIHGKVSELMPLNALHLPGEHNKINIAGAAALTMSLADDRYIAETCESFTGVEHRLELVRELHGAKWYNDSIGTTPTRTIAGLRSYDRKLILIAGGYDKHVSYAPLAPEILAHVKHLILCGPTAVPIRTEVEKLLGDPAALPIDDVENLPAAVARAAEVAGEGDIVLFSPASASFDAYPNFEKRGEHFKKLVGELK